MQLNFARKFLINIKLLKKKELKINLFKSIVLNQNIDNHIRIFYYFKLLSVIKISKMLRLKTRCVLSNNSKFLIRLFGLNRIKLKKLLNLSYINGFSKSSW